MQSLLDLVLVLISPQYGTRVTTGANRRGEVRHN